MLSGGFLQLSSKIWMVRIRIRYVSEEYCRSRTGRSAVCSEQTPAAENIVFQQIIGERPGVERFAFETAPQILLNVTGQLGIKLMQGKP